MVCAVRINGIAAQADGRPAAAAPSPWCDARRNAAAAARGEPEAARRASLGRQQFGGDDGNANSERRRRLFGSLILRFMRRLGFREADPPSHGTGLSNMSALSNLSAQGPRPRTLLLWIDAVGGFRVCLNNPIVLGQTGATPAADVPLLADVRSHHAAITRDSEGYIVEAAGPVRIDGQAVATRAVLPRRCEIALGSLRLKFSQPNPLSLSARIDWVGAPRTNPAVDAVLLMADQLLIGPSAHCHVVCRNWPADILLYRRGNNLHCSAPGQWTIDGRLAPPAAPLPEKTRIEGDGFSFALESA